MKRTAPIPGNGFSLIELLVAMAIGLVLTLAITSVMIRSESSKRSSTSVNDINQSGAYAAYVLDRAIRNSGSGFSQPWNETYGCQLNVMYASAAVLPSPAFPAISAFTRVTVPIRLAPVIIGKGKADVSGETRGDVLMVMSGAAGVGEAPQPVSQTAATPVTSSQLSLRTALGYGGKDIVLFADSTTGTNTCAMDQIGTIPTPYAGAVPLTGTFHRDNSAYGANTFVRQMGRDGANVPDFKLYGVGPNSTLVSYDLLSPPADDAQVSDGIVEMRALYGLDTTVTPTGTPAPDGIVDSWVDATGLYADTALTDGTTGAQKRLRQIIAVRLGLILRTNLKEKAKVATDPQATINIEGVDSSNAASRTLFSDPRFSAFQYVRPDEAGYRFRVVELTIPMPNVLLAQ